MPYVHLLMAPYLYIAETQWVLHQQRKILHEEILALSKRYGKICSFWIGTHYVVVLSGYEAINQALVSKVTCSSKDQPFYQV